jgi:hypothetical protein
MRKKRPFRSPDVLHRAKKLEIMADPDEPLALVILQIETTDGDTVHVRMERGLCMNMLLSGTKELRVDLGLRVRLYSDLD